MHLDSPLTSTKRKRDTESHGLPEPKALRMATLSNRLQSLRVAEGSDNYTDAASMDVEDSNGMGSDNAAGRAIRRAFRTRNSSISTTEALPGFQEDLLRYNQIVDDIKATVVHPYQLSGDLDMDLHCMRDRLERKRQLYGGGLKDEYWKKRGLPTHDLVRQRSALCACLYAPVYGFFYQLHTEIQRAADQSMIMERVLNGLVFAGDCADFVGEPFQPDVIYAAYHLSTSFVAWTIKQTELLDVKNGKGRSGEARVMQLFDNVSRILQALQAMRRCGDGRGGEEFGTEVPGMNATLVSLGQSLVDAGLRLFRAASSKSALPTSGRRILVIAMACKYVQAVMTLVGGNEEEKKRMQSCMYQKLVAALPPEAQATVI
ncbi:hypothetical protein HK097_004031 [Rhizophlyctis rosea]|uniref:Uncharacterized protein n=1 Tax=Rhizophlyctis rosea TaxID=64517 RepID=A0AAD5SS52_9FUNG|nr:hypothetical protein HK097_004031 [Rhizophlyctis rosea]